VIFFKDKEFFHDILDGFALEDNDAFNNSEAGSDSDPNSKGGFKRLGSK